MIGIGSRVRLRDDDGEAEFCIVHAEEADYTAGCISALSPLGSALLGRQRADLVRFRVPAGVLAVTVVEVR